MMIFASLLFAALTIARADVVHVERLSARLDRVVTGPVTVDTIARDLTWTEGPLRLPDGRLLFADIKTNSVRELSPAGVTRILLSPSGDQGPAPYPGPEPGSSAMALDPAGRVVVAGHAGRAVWRFDRLGGPTVEDSRRTTLVTSFRGRRLNSPNDLVIARDGTIYFTDPPFGLPTQKPADPRQQISFTGIYRLTAPGESNQRLTLLTRAVTGANGLALSNDERTLYVADSLKKVWVKFDVRRDGSLGGPKPFATIGADQRAGLPDGLKVDLKGNVFAAGPGGVWIFAADGTHLGTLPLAKKTSNLAWADAKRRSLYVTASDVIYHLHF